MPDTSRSLNYSLTLQAPKHSQVPRVRTIQPCYPAEPDNRAEESRQLVPKTITGRKTLWAQKPTSALATESQSEKPNYLSQEEYYDNSCGDSSRDQTQLSHSKLPNWLTTFPFLFIRLQIHALHGKNSIQSKT